jgi:hypothetical protein
MTVARTAGIAAWIAAAFCATPLSSADYETGARPRPAYAAGIPASACTDPGVLRFITGRFEYKAANYIRQNLSIYEIGKMQLSRYEPFNDYMSSVQREYCVASATLTDGSRRPLLYVIETPWGFAGVGRNIEFCIPGLDPWYVYGDSCDSLR